MPRYRLVIEYEMNDDLEADVVAIEDETRRFVQNGANDTVERTDIKVTSTDTEWPKAKGK